MIPDRSPRLPPGFRHLRAAACAGYAVRMSHSEDDDPDDAALFRAAIGEVKPIRQPQPAPPQRPRPRPRARMAELDEAEAQGEFARLLRDSAPLEAGDTASYRREQVPARVFQRLAQKASSSVQDELDSARRQRGAGGSLATAVPARSACT